MRAGRRTRARGRRTTAVDAPAAGVRGQRASLKPPVPRAPLAAGVACGDGSAIEHAAAVDDDLRPQRPARFVGGQVQHGFGHLLRRAEPAERNAGGDVLVDLIAVSVRNAELVVSSFRMNQAARVDRFLWMTCFARAVDTGSSSAAGRDLGQGQRRFETKRRRGSVRAAVRGLRRWRRHRMPAAPGALQYPDR
jgi:hypothetical protein